MKDDDEIVTIDDRILTDEELQAELEKLSPEELQKIREIIMPTIERFRREGKL